MSSGGSDRNSALLLCFPRPRNQDLQLSVAFSQFKQLIRAEAICPTHLRREESHATEPCIVVEVSGHMEWSVRTNANSASGYPQPSREPNPVRILGRKSLVVHTHNLLRRVLVWRDGPARHTLDDNRVIPTIVHVVCAHEPNPNAMIGLVPDESAEDQFIRTNALLTSSAMHEQVAITRGSCRQPPQHSPKLLSSPH